MYFTFKDFFLISYVVEFCSHILPMMHIKQLAALGMMPNNEGYPMC